MNRLTKFGSVLLLIPTLSGCSIANTNGSSESSTTEYHDYNLNNTESLDSALLQNSESESLVEYPQESIVYDSSTNSVALEEMEMFKKTLKEYIFNEYMPSSEYAYAKGVNWTENTYDNLTAEEIWNLADELKEINSGREGTLFELASYLSVNAPIKENWEELFMENWTYSPNSVVFEIETLIDNGDTVSVYVDKLPYTGEKDNYPFITLYKRTGFWHG